jgi:hypothetical protein
MAIKLYSSQLTPTTKTSNVLDTRKISLSEAASIGKAWKGMVHSGEKLYVKHLDIKSDNEILEKSKEVMNGKTDVNGNVISTGLSEILIKAKEMKDGDKAIAYYNNTWKSLLETEKSNLSWMAKRKFTSWMNMQNLKDTNSIKVATTTNMLNSLRVNYLDKIEILKKSITFSEPESIEQITASSELDELLKSKKAKEIFGSTLDKIKKDTATEIAFFGYKNVPIADQEAALAEAKKDDRIPLDGPYSVDTLDKHFQISKTNSNNLNKDNVSKMESALESGIIFDSNEYNAAVKIATDNKDTKTLLKLKTMAEDAEIYLQLSTMPVADIENRKNILTEYKNKRLGEGKGVALKEARNLEITKKFLSKLTTNLNKDQMTTAHDMGIITLNEIGFSEMLATGNVEEFAHSIKERVAKAKTVAAFYSREIKFFTANEEKSIKDAFLSAKTKDQIIQLSTVLVEGFGSDSDLAFKQLSKDNTFLSTIGGLTIMNDYKTGNNVELAVEGYLISKNEQLKNIYKIPTNDTGYLGVIAKYQTTFLHNVDTFNNIVEAANYIYMAQLRNNGKTTKDFSDKDWEKAFVMAAGGKGTDIGIFGTSFFTANMGGFDEDTRGNQVHIPTWLKNGSFNTVVERLKADENLWLKASKNGKNAIIGDGTKKGDEITLSEIFKEDAPDPYFVSIGNGKYRIAMGENPTDPGAEAEYLMNSDGGFFIININNIRDEIIIGMN